MMADNLTSIYSAEFIRLMMDYRGAPSIAAREECRAIITYIDQHVANQVNAAANKAAEEGEDQMFDKWVMSYSKGKPYWSTARIEICHDAWKAGRASRQVANKAEVEQDKIDAERYRWLQREAERDYVQFTVDSHKDIICECKEALDETIDAAMGIATPPATTGASTASVDTGSVARAWKSLADKAIGILQRNIVPDGISDHAAISELLGVFDGPEYRAAVAREVAAQAGQVAVPDFEQRAKAVWNDALTEARAAVRELQNNLEVFGYSEETARVALDGALDAIDELRASPAKESK